MMSSNPDERSYTRQELEQRRLFHRSLLLDSDPSGQTRKTCAPDQVRERRLSLLVLGSGSKGNAAIVADKATGEGILIDAGICKRDLLAFSEQGGFDLANLKGIFITHAHSDHVKNLGVILRALASLGVEVPLFMHHETLAASKELQKAQEVSEIIFFEAQETILVGPLSILTLPTSHDAAVSFGFRIECGNDALGFITDTGMVLPDTLEALRNVRILGLESNHDEAMLQNGTYPRILKERVGSDKGHLSNTQAAEVFEELLSDRLESVVALHISENNNTYRLPVETLREVAWQRGVQVSVTCAYQHRPVFIDA